MCGSRARVLSHIGDRFGASAMEGWAHRCRGGGSRSRASCRSGRGRERSPAGITRSPVVLCSYGVAERGVRNVVVAALVVASLAMIASGVAFWRTFQVGSDAKAPVPATTVPAGPVLVAVPNVVNRNGLLAAADLAKVKLTITVTSGPSVSVSRDRVMEQDPAPGTRVADGTAIDLKLSTGPP